MAMAGVGEEFELRSSNGLAKGFLGETGVSWHAQYGSGEGVGKRGTRWSFGRRPSSLEAMRGHARVELERVWSWEGVRAGQGGGCGARGCTAELGRELADEVKHQCTISTGQGHGCHQ